MLATIPKSPPALHWNLVPRASVRELNFSREFFGTRGTGFPSLLVNPIGKTSNVTRDPLRGFLCYTPHMEEDFQLETNEEQQAPNVCESCEG